MSNPIFEHFPASFQAWISDHQDFSPIAKRLIPLGLASTLSRYLSHASAATYTQLFADIERLDVAHLERHRATLLNTEKKESLETPIEPLPSPEKTEESLAQNREQGRRSLMKGDWALAVFAGGAGTRFFKEWSQINESMPKPNEVLKSTPPDPSEPKGLFPISPVCGQTFLERQVADILETGMACGKLPFFFIMTSPVTEKATHRWLSESTLYGFPKGAVHLLRQGVIPRIDEAGNLIANPDGSLLMTGNGHGGIYSALQNNRVGDFPVLDFLKLIGISHLVMGNVDNAALNAFEPERLGHHQRTDSDFTLSVVSRSDPHEKVGLVCLRTAEDMVDVLEYSVIDPAISGQTEQNGTLTFDEAHINSNLLKLDALRSDLPGTLYTGKPITLDGQRIESSTYEMLNQHLTSLIPKEKVHTFKGSRDHYFIPTKAVVGKDSVSTTFHALNRQTASCLRLAGASLSGPEDKPTCFTDIHACLGHDEHALKSKGIGRKWKLETGSRLYLSTRHGVLTDRSPYDHGLHLETDASLIIRTEFPYGKPIFAPETRSIGEMPMQAGRLSLGNNVTVKAGVSIIIDLMGSSCLTIPDNTVFANDLTLTVADGEQQVVSWTGS